MSNLGYHFYKNYYRPYGQRIFDPRKFKSKDDTKKVDAFNDGFFKEKNAFLFKDAEKRLHLNKVLQLEAYIDKIPGFEHFMLKTTYPGLLIGSGYNHETGSMDELKLGFFFDYTTGLPVIPASSIKGAIRSLFPQFKQDKNDKLAFNDDNEIQSSRALYIWQMVYDDQAKKELSIDEKRAIHYLELELFENINIYTTIDEREKHNDKRNEYLPGNFRDIFFDAFSSVIAVENFNNEKRLLGDDFITPHKHATKRELDPFTNPTPIKFLKVLPEVVFQFSFRLNNSSFIPIVDGTKKCKIFKSIISTFGLGAKTNVGYGQFQLTDKSETTQHSVEKDEGEKQNKASTRQNKGIENLFGTHEATVIEKVMKKIWTVKVKGYNDKINLVVSGNLKKDEMITIHRNSSTDKWKIKN